MFFNKQREVCVNSKEGVRVFRFLGGYDKLNLESACKKGEKDKIGSKNCTGQKYGVFECSGENNRSFLSSIQDLFLGPLHYRALK